MRNRGGIISKTLLRVGGFLHRTRFELGEERKERTMFGEAQSIL